MWLRPHLCPNPTGAEWIATEPEPYSTRVLFLSLRTGFAPYAVNVSWSTESEFVLPCQTHRALCDYWLTLYTYNTYINRCKVSIINSCNIFNIIFSHNESVCVRVAWSSSPNLPLFFFFLYLLPQPCVFDLWILMCPAKSVHPLWLAS